MSEILYLCFVLLSAVAFFFLTTLPIWVDEFGPRYRIIQKKGGSAIIEKRNYKTWNPFSINMSKPYYIDDGHVVIKNMKMCQGKFDSFSQAEVALKQHIAWEKEMSFMKKKFARDNSKRARYYL